VDGVFPFAEAKQAIAHPATGPAKGTVVLTRRGRAAARYAR
jgi:hypothetical protein